MRKILATVTVGLVALVVIARGNALPFLLSTNYLPHRYCYLAQPWLVGMNVAMDGLIAAAYVVIFACLFWIKGRLRDQPEIQPYAWVFSSFGIFIFACASTHLMEVVTIWWPVYRLAVAVKVICAAASVVTGVLLLRAAPVIIQSIGSFLEQFSRGQREHVADAARLQAIFDSVLDSILTIDARGTIASINSAVETMFEYHADEMVGQNIRMLMPEPDRSAHDGYLARYQSTGMTTAIGVGRKLEGLTKTGRVFPIELTITEVSLDGQKSFVGLIRDLSQRNRSEEELKNRAALLNLAHDAIFVRDLNNRITFWNHAAERMYGWPAEEARGHVTHELLQTQLPAPLDAILTEFLHTGDWEGEVRHTTRAGVHMVVASRWSLQRDQGGAPTAIMEVNRDVTERRQAQEAREQLAAVVDSSDDAIISKSLNGTIMAWNRGARKVFGYEAEEAVGQPIRIIMPPELISEEDDILARVARGESVEHFETVRVRKDSERIDVSITISPIRNDKGVIIGSSKVARDITDRKRAEQALREKGHLLAESQRIAHIGSWTCDVNDAAGRLVWSEELYRIYGVSADTFAPSMEELLNLLLPEDRLAMRSWMAACGAGESPADLEFRILRPDGSIRICSRRGELQYDSEHQPLRMAGTTQDITELRHSRQALEAQKLMLQSVLDSMVEGLVAADEQGKFILWNPAAERIIGLGAADLSPEEWSAHYGIYLPDMVTPFPNEQDPLTLAIRGESSRAEMVICRPGREQETWIESNGAPLKDKEGVVRGGVVAFRDITQRRADELEIRTLNEDLEERIAERTAQLETANRELSAFSYSVSHDLRAPLRHISGFSRILINDFGPEMTVEARGHLQRIEDAVIRMGQLVDGLLSLARLGRQSLKLQCADLSALVHEVIGILELESDGRVIEWRIGELPPIECDRVLMAQVFQNLLSNALKYSCRRARAVIEVDSIQEPGKPAILFVRDNGAGFNMLYADKLFEVFKRMHSESEFEGTGVGLATVHRIIQKHGGRIWAEAEVDRGATFYFTLEVGEQTPTAPLSTSR